MSSDNVLLLLGTAARRTTDLGNARVVAAGGALPSRIRSQKRCDDFAKRSYDLVSASVQIPVRGRPDGFEEECFSPRSTDAIADADEVGVADVEQLGDAPHEVVFVPVELAVRERHSP